MRFLKKLLLLLLILAVVIVGVAYFLPSSSHVERSIVIQRPASEVFAVLNSYRRFNEWSPWAAKDPNAKYTISGPASGVGAMMSWQGDPKTVGSGSQKIVESNPDSSITTALNFGDMGQAKARFLLTPMDNATKVEWTLDSSLPLAPDRQFIWDVVGRYMGLFMDRMVGPDYELGLAKLKTLVETFPAADIRGISGEPTTLSARKIYYISGSADSSTAKAVLTDAYTRLQDFIKASGVSMQGAPLTITSEYTPSNWKFDAALPVDRNDVAPSGDIKAGTTYAGKAVSFIHTGPYETMSDTINKAFAWLAVQGYKPTDRVIEEYVNDPGSTPQDQLKTRIVVPVE